SSDLWHERTKISKPANRSLRTNQIACINRRDICHHIHVINRKNTKSAIHQRREIRAFGNVVNQDHCMRRILAENLLSRRTFKYSAKTSIFALAKSDEIAAFRSVGSENRRCNESKREWFCTRPYLNQVIADRGSPSKGRIFARKATMGRNI